MTTASGSTAGLDIGGVFEKTGEIYKSAFGTVWLVALILMIPASIIAGLLNDADSAFVRLIGNLVQLVATVWLAGTIVRVVQDIEADGRVDLGVGELFGSVAPKLISLALLSIVTSILIGIGLIFLIVPGVILALMWLVATPAMVVEDKGVFDSMSRSSDLTKHNRMRILAVGILLLVAYFVIALAVALLVAVTPVLGIVAGIVLAVVIYPYVSIIVTVLYFRLLELKEGGAVIVEETIVEEGFDPPPAV